jgi:hypothetical protein
MGRLLVALLVLTPALLIQVAVLHVHWVPTALAALMSLHAAGELLVTPRGSKVSLSVLLVLQVPLVRMDHRLLALLVPTQALVIQVAVIHVHWVPTALAVPMSQHAAGEVLVTLQGSKVNLSVLLVL